MLADHPVLKIVYLTECKCTVLSVCVRWERSTGKVWEGMAWKSLRNLCTAKVSIAWVHLS